MEIEYVIINFLILALILIIFGRKTAVKIFKSRREKINSQLDMAEKLEAQGEPVFTDSLCQKDCNQPSQEVLAAKAAADDKMEQVRHFGETEKREIHREMIENSRFELFELLTEKVKGLFSAEPYLSQIRSLEEKIVDTILEKIELTSGDMSYLKQHDVLYVTLTSAFPLSNELVEKVREKTDKLLSSVGGKTSLWVIEDAELIGGLRLRIGDTVYDGTVAEALYHFKKSLTRDPIFSEDAEGELIKEFADKAKNFKTEISIYQLGRVMTVSDGICWMDGLADIMYGEIVEFDCGERGMVLDIQQNKIGCVIFGEYEHLESGSKVRRAGRIASVPVGEALLGRVVDAVGNAVDGEGYLNAKERRPIEFKAPAILDRAPVDSSLHTGVTAIDALVPIGKGQRELIIGDRQSGKSALALDAIINQKGKGTICIYVAIGQKETSIAEIRSRLKTHDALDYTIIVAAPAAGSAALQYIAPFSATAMGEYFMYSGRDVLIVYDDLSKHAVAYRELSLLLHRPSGREAFPGDVFYLHSRLLERSARLSDELGGGSMTALPLIETQAGDISAYIPTNVISITDGQIFLDTELFNEGQRPAINVGLSVSRVGSAAQSKAMKQVSGNLRARLAQYRELADFMQFGSDVDESTRSVLEAGKRLMEILKQPRFSPIPDYIQVLLLFAADKGFAKNVAVENMEEFKKKVVSSITKDYPQIIERLKKGDKLDNAFIKELTEALSAALSEE